MSVEIVSNAFRVTALLEGEIDHHTAAAIRMDIDAAASAGQPDVLRLDFSGVTFMDSSAIGLVMGRYRLVKSWGGRIEAINLSQRHYQMMMLAGMQSLCTLGRKEENNESN